MERVEMRKRIALLTVTVFLTISAPAVAVCEYINLSLNSYHWDRDRDYNERHVNLGCGNIAGSGWSFMYFENSNYDHAALLTKHYHWRSVWIVDLGYELGLVAGYDQIPIAPIILPKASAEFGRIRVTGYVLVLGGVALATAYRF